jgi:hypothetical protein
VLRRSYEAPWERVGLEPARLRTHPLRVLGKGVFAAITAALPPTRSMLLVVGEK